MSLTLWDHPDLVLVRAVASAVIDLDEHLLIAATRLEDVPLRRVADELGISVSLAGAWRRRVERRLAAAIADHELDWLTVSARDCSGKRADHHRQVDTGHAAAG